MYCAGAVSLTQVGILCLSFDKKKILFVSFISTWSHFTLSINHIQFLQFGTACRLFPHLASASVPVLGLCHLDSLRLLLGFTLPAGCSSHHCQFFPNTAMWILLLCACFLLSLSPAYRDPGFSISHHPDCILMCMTSVEISGALSPSLGSVTSVSL